MTKPNDHPMDTFLGGELVWNNFTPDAQELIGFTIQAAAKLRPGWLTREALDDIVRFVPFAQRRKAGQEARSEHEG